MPHCPGAALERRLDIAPTTDHPEDLPEPDLLRAAGLTSAELDLLPLLMRDLSLTEISETVGLPRSTVEVQARSIDRKLGVSPSDLTSTPRIDAWPIS